MANNKEVISIDQIAKETLSGETLKGVKSLLLVVNMRGNNKVKVKVNRTRVEVYARLGLRQAIAWTIFLGGAIGGIIKFVA